MYSNRLLLKIALEENIVNLNKISDGEGFLIIRKDVDKENEEIKGIINRFMFPLFIDTSYFYNNCLKL